MMRCQENWGHNVAVLGALSCEGLDAVMSVEDAADASVFRAYVTRVLAPTLQADDVVVMDNLSTHKVRGIRDAIEARGAALVYLPSYSPDYSPIEPCWSKLKRACAASRRAPGTPWMRPCRRSSKR